MLRLITAVPDSDLQTALVSVSGMVEHSTRLVCEEDVAMQTCLGTPAWYHAITLTERIASLRAAPRKMLDVEINAELVERRMQRWRSQPPFTASPHFAQRLAMDSITEDDLRYLLGEPIEAVHARFPAPPDGWRSLPRRFLVPLPPIGYCSQSNGVVKRLSRFWALSSRSSARAAIACIRESKHWSRRQSDLPFDPSTVEEIMFANLPGQLLTMLTRTMVLELHMARLQGFLEGDTPEERFRSFLQRVCQRATALTLLREYPVLARQLMIRMDQWVRFSLEFLQHLCADWEAIRTTFTPKNDPGVLVQVHRGMSASHQGARSVLIARFSSGVQVVYKPWPMAVDVHFQELLTWLNDRGNHPPFHTLTILDRGTYGWVEFVAAQSCSSVGEIRRFYERQGGYLALLYALEAVDFRFENLIAAGEHPVLIDLDTLFHARAKGTDFPHLDSPCQQGDGIFCDARWVTAPASMVEC